METNEHQNPRQPIREGATRLRSGKASATRQHILTAAREVFRENGYVEANVGQIISKCGVSRGAFYYHFRSKDDVFAAVVIQAMNELGDRLFPSDAGLPAFQRIYNANLQYLYSYREYADIFSNLMQAANVSPRGKALHKKLWLAPVSRIERHLRRELESGRTRSFDPTIVAGSLCAMLDTFCYRWMALGYVDIPDETVHRVAHEISTIWYLAVYGEITEAPQPQQVPIR